MRRCTENPDELAGLPTHFNNRVLMPNRDDIGIIAGIVDNRVGMRPVADGLRVDIVDQVFVPRRPYSPGFISISSPTFRVPCFRTPAITPPLSFSIFVPGLFISKLLATRNTGSDSRSLLGGVILESSSVIASILISC